jgi:type I restriction enzyme S subunit
MTFGLPIVPPGSTIFPKNGGAIATGKKRITAIKCSLDLNTMGVIPRGIDSQFLFYWFHTIDLSALSDGTVVPQINKSDLSPLDFPCPPLDEQKRIVEKLNRLMARSGRAREGLERIPKLIERYKQAVLAAAFSGELTREWRSGQKEFEVNGHHLLEQAIDAHNDAGGHKKGNAAPPTEEAHLLSSELFPSTWALAELRDIIEPSAPITYGILKPGPDVPDGVKYIRVADYPGDRLDAQGVRATSREIDAEFKRSRLREGDILLSIRGTVGRVCRIPRELDGANITQDSARLRIQKMIDADFIEWMIRSPAAQSAMGRAMKGVAVRGINIGDVRALQIPIPPKDEQTEIIAQITERFSAIEKIAYEAMRANKLLKRLDQLVLSKAFKGELVSQDPSDEPASVLLKRIHNARAEEINGSQKGRARRENSRSLFE